MADRCLADAGTWLSSSQRFGRAEACDEESDGDGDPDYRRDDPCDRINDIIPKIEALSDTKQKDAYRNVQCQRGEEKTSVNRVAEDQGNRDRERIAAIAERVGVVIEKAD